MINEINKKIEEIYVNGKKEIFSSGCKNEIAFIGDLISNIEKSCIKVDVNTDQTEPVVEIQIMVNNYSINEINIEYSSILKINKLVNYYYLQHEFSFENPDPEGIDPYLDNFRDEAYSKIQFNLDEKITEYMKLKGYSRLSYMDMEEIFPGIKKIPERSEINKMTVNNALFMDLWNLCSSD